MGNLCKKVQRKGIDICQLQKLEKHSQYWSAEYLCASLLLNMPPESNIKIILWESPSF